MIFIHKIDKIPFYLLEKSRIVMFGNNDNHWVSGATERFQEMRMINLYYFLWRKFEIS